MVMCLKQSRNTFHKCLRSDFIFEIGFFSIAGFIIEDSECKGEKEGETMLTAKGIDGRLFTLPEKVSTDLLPTIKAAQPFYCPCCDSEVVVKAGFIKIPHFAHKSHASCHASSEPESDYHLLAKRNLFTWFLFTWLSG